MFWAVRFTTGVRNGRIYVLNGFLPRWGRGGEDVEVQRGRTCWGEKQSMSLEREEVVLFQVRQGGGGWRG